MYRYCVSGLSLSSEFPLPELGDARAEATGVLIRREPVDVAPPDGHSGGSWARMEPDDATLHWRDFGTIRVRRGELVEVDAHEDIDPAWVRTVVLGQVMTLVLAQRGLFPLHASSVAVGGSAIALAADSGDGKSTLAAALVAHGQAFLSDDVSALRQDGPTLHVQPSVRRQKLDDSSLRALGHDPESFPHVHSREAKRAVPVPAENVGGELPLRAVYVLEHSEQADGPSFEVLPRATAFTQLMRHLHRVELLTSMLGQEEILRRCAAVASAVPLVRFRRPRGFEHLEDDVLSVLEHAR
ncbi:MAG: hypothetical protein GY711_29525 [bacterium]|nr:hypothetical protein [bacterium]